MKAISFNVNSVRQRLHQLQALIDNHAPDVIGLQETKVTDEDFPLAQIQAMGYNAIFTGQKTHYGVALLVKAPLVYSNSFIAFDNAEDDAQKRIIGADITLKSGKTVSVINGYFPQGEAQDHPVKFPAKQKFYEDLQAHLTSKFSPDSPLIVMGDMNISPTDLDIGIGEDNRKRWLRTGKCSFLPIEREWINRLYGWGLTDTYRHQNPECSEFYSWFDYRSRGFEREPKRGLRIDLILATKPLLNTLKSTGIDYEVRGLDKSSDHAPIWAEFDY